VKISSLLRKLGEKILRNGNGETGENCRNGKGEGWFNFFKCEFSTNESMSGGKSQKHVE
jgi:hypothetical protein